MYELVAKMVKEMMIGDVRTSVDFKLGMWLAARLDAKRQAHDVVVLTSQSARLMHLYTTIQDILQ